MKKHTILKHLSWNEEGEHGSRSWSVWIIARLHMVQQPTSKQGELFGDFRSSSEAYPALHHGSAHFTSSWSKLGRKWSSCNLLEHFNQGSLTVPFGSARPAN
ncbi:hypothetical protein LR48_Vigan07g012900 [Vigna angularis]|uniref:Uncharacterized protein n=2 Tax=Phaseolus angularis TaxID=3914 RepID=A0A0L9UU76_PHAAN|nr:hypothetical protein LR48_Vigan07g012900 [Vigna angularis]BAT80606.1 hypothetical protein VIGAN_03019700 [Vigna angularis var. angularis]